jgi:protein O-GlcNAc transferase
MPPDHLDTASALTRAGRPAEAEAIYQQLLAANPNDLRVLFVYASFAAHFNRLPLAADLLTRAVAIDPNDPELHHALGTTLLLLNRYAAAVPIFEKLVTLTPDSAEAHMHLGTLLVAAGRASEAIPAFHHSLQLNPHSAPCLYHLGSAHTVLGQIPECLAAYRNAFALDPTLPALPSAIAFNLNYDDTAEPQAIFDEHLRVCAHLPAPAPPPNRPLINRKIRIGYISPDFRAQSLAFFISPLLTHFNRDRFEVFVYADVANPDAVTQRLRSSPVVWRDISALPDDRAQSLIRSDQLDIFVDLAVHNMNNRLPLVARKPAPIVVNYLGYPNTSGHRAHDYRIVDNHVDPPGVTDRFHSEKLLRLPNSFLCFVPPNFPPAPAPPPCLTRNHITFGCFNNILKISPLTVSIWSELLHALPTSRLVLKSSYAADPGSRSVLLGRFAKHNIDLSRISFLDREPITRDHLLRYSEMDIALDTLPFAGFTTTCEALLMGVPVVSLPGPTHVSRVGISILTASGFPEFLATDASSFVSIATRLASDPSHLASLRQSIRPQLLTSPLCDALTHTREMERLYDLMLSSH